MPFFCATSSSFASRVVHHSFFFCLVFCGGNPDRELCGQKGSTTGRAGIVREELKYVVSSAQVLKNALIGDASKAVKVLQLRTKLERVSDITRQLAPNIVRH